MTGDGNLVNGRGFFPNGWGNLSLAERGGSCHRLERKDVKGH